MALGYSGLLTSNFMPTIGPTYVSPVSFLGACRVATAFSTQHATAAFSANEAQRPSRVQWPTEDGGSL